MINNNIPKYGVKPRSLMGLGGHFVKYYLIDKLIDNNSTTCLLIDGGQGNDINKYYNIGIRNMTLTDPFQDQLDRAKKTIERYTDLTVRLINIAFNSNDYIKYVTSGNKSYDIIDWQFAIHFSWSRDQKDIIASKLETLLPVGKKLLITCFDGDKLLDLLRKIKSIKFMINDTDYFEFEYVDNVKYKFNGGEFTVEENYVFLPELKKSLSDSNIRLQNEVNFTEVIVSNINNSNYSSTPNMNSSVFKLTVDELRARANTHFYNEMLKYYNYMVGLTFVRQ